MKTWLPYKKDLVNNSFHASNQWIPRLRDVTSHFYIFSATIEPLDANTSQLNDQIALKML